MTGTPRVSAGSCGVGGGAMCTRELAGALEIGAKVSHFAMI